MSNYGDVEALLIGWLAAQFPSARVCAELPATLPTLTIQVARFGGAPADIPFDYPRVDVDTLGMSRQSALDLARDVQHALMYSLPGYAANGCRVISASCDSGPTWVPYDNTSVRRTSASYTLRTHNPI